MNCAAIDNNIFPSGIGMCFIMGELKKCNLIRNLPMSAALFIGNVSVLHRFPVMLGAGNYYKKQIRCNRI